MIVIADTSPISYLIRIDLIDILPKLYGSILVPPSVRDELKHPRAPEAVRRWDRASPGLAGDTRSYSHRRRGARAGPAGPGERDAILLAEELEADELIIDELRGRNEARRRQLQITGTVGILRAAAESGLLDLRNALERLRSTNFHIAQDTLDRLIAGENSLPRH